MVLVICAGGVIGMENPQNSLIGMHERFCWFIRLLESFGISVLW